MKEKTKNNHKDMILITSIILILSKSVIINGEMFMSREISSAQSENRKYIYIISENIAQSQEKELGHEKKEKEIQGETLGEKGLEGIENFEEEIENEEGIGEKEVENGNFAKILMGNLFENLHNKVVHFPIALGMTSALFELINFFNPSFSVATHILVGLTALSSHIAVATGKKMEREVREELSKDYEKILELHEVMGFTLMIIYSILFIMKFIPSLKKMSSILVIVMAIPLALTGHLGGLLAH